MTWVRLDDKFWRNPKMRRLSHAARGLFCDSLSYCADTPEPTGFLTYSEARDRGPRRLIVELETNGNLEVVHGGWLIHDFEHYIERGSRDRCRAWRERKRTESERHANVTETSPRATGLETISTSGVLPVPSRPGSDGVKPLQQGGLTIESRGYRGGEAESLEEILERMRRQPVRLTPKEAI